MQAQPAEWKLAGRREWPSRRRNPVQLRNVQLRENCSQRSEVAFYDLNPIAVCGKLLPPVLDRGVILIEGDQSSFGTKLRGDERTVPGSSKCTIHIDAVRLYMQCFNSFLLQYCHVMEQDVTSCLRDRLLQIKVEVYQLLGNIVE